MFLLFICITTITIKSFYYETHLHTSIRYLCCLYASSVYAQQLVAPAGRESPAASWVIGEVVGGYYQTDDCMIVQGILSYIDLSSSVGLETDEWQEKTVIWPSPIGDYLNISILRLLLWLLSVSIHSMEYWQDSSIY